MRWFWIVLLAATACGGGGDPKACNGAQAVDDAETVDEDSADNLLFVFENDQVAPACLGPQIKLDGPMHGQAMVASGCGVYISYTPDPGFTGVDTITYTLANGVHATVTITVQARPTAVDDVATVPEDSGPMTIDVLANDQNPNNVALEIIGVGNVSSGSVTVAGDKKSLSFTPAPGFVGTATFTYTITGGSMATVTIAVHAVNHAPVAVDDSGLVVHHDTSADLDVCANDTDSDLDLLVPVIATAPMHGTATVAAGKVHYTPTPGYTGSDSFTYFANDGKTNSANAATVSIMVVDDAPVAVADSFSVNQNTTGTFDPLANDTDTDGGPKSIASITQPANGTATIDVAGTHVVYTPASGYCNDPTPPFADTFTYTLAPGGSTANIDVYVRCQTVTNAVTTPSAGDTDIRLLGYAVAPVFEASVTDGAFASSCLNRTQTGGGIKHYCQLGGSGFDLSVFGFEPTALGPDLAPSSPAMFVPLNPPTVAMGSEVKNTNTMVATEQSPAVYVATFDQVGSGPFTGSLYQWSVGEDGGLTPFATPAYALGGQTGTHMALAPSEGFLYVPVTTLTSSFTGTVAQFALGPTGAVPLTPPTVTVGGGAQGAWIDPSGKYVYVSDAQDQVIAQYAVQVDGTLAPQATPTVSLGTNQLSDLAFSGTNVYAIEQDASFATHLIQMSIDVAGSLSTVGPVTLPGTNCRHLAVDAQNSVLLVACSSSNQIYGFQIASDGSLTSTSWSPLANAGSPNTIEIFVSKQF